jgi:DNA-binding beta-propeller fold protein YncE
MEDGRLEKSNRIKVSDDTINSILGKKMKAGRFQPSGLARHPATGDWYLISSVNKLLIVANSNFEIESVWPLLPSRFRQPEGIAFDRLGNMYISNEGDEVSSGNVLKFEYHPPNSQP